MEKTKKSKKSNIDKLRDLLDNDSKKDLHREDEKYLKSLSKRLNPTSKKEIVYSKKPSSKEGEKDESFLKPRVTIHAREQKKITITAEPEEKKVESKTDVSLPDVELKSEKVEKICLEDENIFEVEKINVKGPEFIEVKPKEPEKKEEFIPIPIKKEEKSDDNELSEWQPVEVEKEEKKAEEPAKEPIKIQETQTIAIHYCSDCGSKIIKESRFCTECGSKIKTDVEEDKKESEALEKETPPPTFIPVKKIEDKDKTPGWEPVEVEETAEEKVESVPVEQLPVDDLQIFEESDVDNAVKVDAFKNIESISEETAVLLYDNGFTSVDSLKIASVKDLARIKGVKRQTAKNIKKELESEEMDEVFDKPSEVQPVLIEDTTKEEKIEEQTKKDAEWGSVGEEEKIQDKIEENIGWEPIDIKEDNTAKIEPFKNIESIDEKTAILLYDNGYTTADSLKTADIKELTKIKGLKKKTAKGIKKELDEALEKSVDVKPIVMGESSKEELSEDAIKVDDEIFEKETKELNPVELSAKDAEWGPVDEEEITELEEEKIQDKIEENIGWEPIDIKEDNTAKIEPFKNIESIDEKTAILLYDNGYTTADSLKTADIKKLTKIKGLKKKTAKGIKKELEIEDATVNEDVFGLSDEITHEAEEKPVEFLSEEKIKKDESEELDERIIKHKPEVEIKEETFEEEEVIEGIPPIVEDTDDVFKDVNSIDEKTSKLLIENGINSVKILKGKTIKELTNVRGIKKKTAKEIKKEIDAIVKRDHDKNVSYERENNPFIDESDDDEWDFLEEKSIPKEVIIGISEYRHGDYTLYEKEMATKSGKKQKVRFFSKGKPDEGKPIQLPDGYEVKENKKTGVPYIRKKK